MSYTVTVKQVYTYEDVPGKTEEEAKQAVLDMDWQGHDEQSQPLQIEVKEN